MAEKPTYEELEQKVKELEKEVVKHKRAKNSLIPNPDELDLSNAKSETPDLVNGKYSIKDLIDIQHFRGVLEKFSKATGFTTGLVSYPEQETLIGTGWRDICTKYHRVFPESEKHCKKSNRSLTSQLKELKELNVRPCKNGLVEGATPIIIKGKHIASLLTGQILFKKPDIERFRRQGESYGYDIDAYLDALNKVPIVTEKQFKSALSFLGEIAVMIGELGLINLKLKESTWGLEREIIERKQVKMKLAEKSLKLKRLNEELRRKNEELNEFTYFASHDLRAPLRKLSAFCDLLKKDLGEDLPEQAEKDLFFIADAALRMQTLVQDLLKLSHTSRMDMKFEQFSLDTCVNSALKESESEIAETEAEIVCNELPEVWGDKTLLTQLYRNLLGNALKFRDKEHPRIEITVENKDGVSIFGVKDNGIGISTAYAEQIFRPFKRLHSQTEYEGTGIGLAICRKAIERHTGEIWVESEPGKGAHFKFTIRRGDHGSNAEEAGNHSSGRG
ncbi:MAG: PocR ligand-binding domain-containing protein [Desulfobacterales bacterium]